MKIFKILFLTALIIVGGLLYATQDSTLEQHEVRDPRVLERILEANASDAETRLLVVEVAKTNSTARLDSLEIAETNATARLDSLEISITNKVDSISEGYFTVLDSTQLVFIASGVTNEIDADITN